MCFKFVILWLFIFDNSYSKSFTAFKREYYLEAFHIPWVQTLVAGHMDRQRCSKSQLRNKWSKKLVRSIVQSPSGHPLWVMPLYVLIELCSNNDSIDDRRRWSHHHLRLSHLLLHHLWMHLLLLIWHFIKWSIWFYLYWYYFIYNIRI